MPLDKQRLQGILTELRRQLNTLYGDRLVKMILYGSQARGDARQWSDIDVLVVLRGPVRASQEVRRSGGIVSGMCLEFDVDIQCLFVSEDQYERSEGPVLQDAHREGVEV